LTLNKKPNCRKENVRLLRRSVLAKYNDKTIFADIIGLFFDHCDVIGL